MSEPELKVEIDEYGRIKCCVTNEGVLLSKDEKEFIIDHVTRIQNENAKLKELVKSMYYDLTQTTFPPDWVTDYEADMRELGLGDVPNKD